MTVRGTLVLNPENAAALARHMIWRMQRHSEYRLQLIFRSSINSTSRPDLIAMSHPDAPLTFAKLTEQLNSLLSKHAGGSGGDWELADIVVSKSKSK
jgi:hypothetical protein